MSSPMNSSMSSTRPLACVPARPYFRDCLKSWERKPRTTYDKLTFHGCPSAAHVRATRGKRGTYAVNPPGIGNDRERLHDALTGVYRFLVGGAFQAYPFGNSVQSALLHRPQWLQPPELKRRAATLSEHTWIPNRTTAPAATAATAPTAPTAPAGISAQLLPLQQLANGAESTAHSRVLSSLKLAALLTLTTPAPGVRDATMSNSNLTDHRTRPFLWIDNATLKHIGANVGPYGIAVYAAIAMHTKGRGNTAWPGASRIATVSGCCVRKVKSTLQELEGAGVLGIERREGATSVFTLQDPPVSEKGSEQDPPVSGRDADSGGGVHDMHGGGARHARGGVHDMHPNKNHITRTKKKRDAREGAREADASPPPHSNSDSPPSSTDESADSNVDAGPLLNVFRRTGATVNEKRRRILKRWARSGFIDNISLFAEVVQDDYDGKGRILSMKTLKQKYIEATQRAVEGAARRNGRPDAKATPKGIPNVNAAVSHATASGVVQDIRSDIDGKAQLSEHFEVVKQDGTTKFKPTTVTARAVLATQSESQ